MLKDKATRLFIVLGAFFITNALIAEFIGVKIFSLEKTLGFDPVGMRFFGVPELSFNMTAGVLLWPVVFLLTDIVNEYFGKRGVRIFSYLAVAMIAYAYFMVYFSIQLVPSDYWIMRDIPSGKLNMELSFRHIFGQGLWIIIGSLIAFLIGQFVDVAVFHYFRSFTGSSKIWLRATGSTLVSQFIDSFVVLFVAFYIGADWTLRLVLAIGLVNYLYKFVVAVVLTPLLYVAHYVIDDYLGVTAAQKLKASAPNK